MNLPSAIIATLLSFTLTAAGQPLPQQEKQQVWYQCIARMVASLDDNTSDAGTIAAAAYAECRKAREQAISGLLGPDKQPLVEKTIKKLRDEDVDGITSLVLQARRLRKSN